MFWTPDLTLKFGILHSWVAYGSNFCLRDINFFHSSHLFRSFPSLRSSYLTGKKDEGVYSSSEERSGSGGTERNPHSSLFFPRGPLLNDLSSSSNGTSLRDDVISCVSWTSTSSATTPHKSVSRTLLQGRV